MDKEGINKRIAQVLNDYDLSASAFADRINVPKSSISHLLNGRNKPSLDFVLKVLDSFPEIDLYWLLFGTNKDQNKTVAPEKTNMNTPAIPNSQLVTNKTTEKIVVFYEDGTFKEFYPSS